MLVAILFGRLLAISRTAPSPLRERVRGEGEMLEIGFAVTLSPTPLPSRERGSVSETYVQRHRANRFEME